MIAVVTHRGLDPSISNYYAESSAEAFEDQLKRGYGLEFDVVSSKDEVLVISHDKNLYRISHGQINREISELEWNEISKMSFDGCRLINFDGLLKKAAEISGHGLLAVHLKYQSQSTKVMNVLVEKITKGLEDKFIIFDLKLRSAVYLKERNSNLHLAASVAHPFDIQRYGNCVGGTLFSVEEVVKHRDLFDWVWLDEWDVTDEGGGKKTLYNEGVFQRLRRFGFKIALASPELHGTSPGLLGGETHPDASSPSILRSRMVEIAKLQPDIVCTDFPDMFFEVVQEMGKSN